MEDETDILPADKHESFLQVDSITLVGVARHVQNTQNNCTITLQHLKGKFEG